MSRMRKPPVMAGVFSEAASDFVNYKRSIGFKYEHEPKCISRFCRFSEERGVQEIEISKALAEAWIAPREREASKNRAHRISCIRQFALYLDSLGYNAYIIPEQKGVTAGSFVPYIFTHDEIKAVIKAADDTAPCEMAKNMHLSLPVIFRILYGCGLRVSEVVNLRYKDVNLEEGLLTIREAKADRDRLIPMSDSVKRACAFYSEKIWWEKDDGFFFPVPDKTMVSPMTIYQRYRRYLQAAGISHGGKGSGPRLHDIRHTFAVHVLQKWVSEGTDFARYLTQFLSMHLPGQRGTKRNTQLSYRDSFALLLEYCRNYENISPEKLKVPQVNRELVLRFLQWLEESRNCKPATRNQRLAAIHSFFSFLRWGPRST